MILFNIKRVVLLAILVVGLQAILNPNAPIDESRCKIITEKPSFSEELVLGKKWRAYYVWDFDESVEPCFEISFKRANLMIVNTVRSTMRSFLDNEPDWSKATLFMKLSPVYYRSLLIPDPSGIPGYYQEIVFISRHGPRSPEEFNFKIWHIFHVAFKLLGRYLILHHCRSNVIFLMVAQEDNVKVDRQEIKELAESLQLGKPMLSCFPRKNNEEI